MKLLRTGLFALLCLSSMSFTNAVFSQEKSDSKGKEPAKDATKTEKAEKKDDDSPLVKKATVKVEKGPLSSSVTVKGTIEGDQSAEVLVKLKNWGGPLIVEKAVEQGTPVKKGDVLIKFDPEKLEHALRDAREERKLATLALELAEKELPVLKKQLPLDLEAAEKEHQHAATDLKRFLEIEKQAHIEQTQFMLKSAQFNVDSSKDELTQLQKMYRDKDLTEETEKMILRRYQFMMEMSELGLKHAKLHADRDLNIDLPRREEQQKLHAIRSELGVVKARDQLPLLLKQKELALEKQRFDDARAKEKLADLEKDMDLMVIKAPVDGVAYQGRYAKGHWTGPQGNAFLPGSTIPANEIIYTIIPKGKLALHGEIEEKEFDGLKTGLTARVSPTISADKKFDGKVNRVTTVPQAGKFEVVVALGENAPANLVPGMTGSAKIVTHKKEAALTVPSSAVFEETETDSWYVYLPGEKPKKKTVKVGLTVGEKVEILDGLAEGDEILAAKP